MYLNTHMRTHTHTRIYTLEQTHTCLIAHLHTDRQVLMKCCLRTWLYILEKCLPHFEVMVLSRGEVSIPPQAGLYLFCVRCLTRRKYYSRCDVDENPRTYVSEWKDREQ